MKILVVATNYPYPGYPLSGIFNETTVFALRNLGHEVEVLAPRPFVPPVVSRWVSRWKTYQTIPFYEVRQGIKVYRPAYLQVPKFAQAFSIDWNAYVGCSRLSLSRHRAVGFDGILSFDLIGPAVMSWRLGQDLGVPTIGWVTSGIPRLRSFRRVISRALEKFDAVFYQSRQNLEEGADLLSAPMSPMTSERHRVLPRGILPPPPLPRADLRRRLRREWGVADDEILVLNIGRIIRAKGVFELLEAVERAAKRNPKIKAVLVGSAPSIDDSHLVRRKLEESPWLRGRVKLLPVCGKDRVWECLCAADIFAFPSSHPEGMPNSLLEAMATELPVVAFDIPPVREAKGDTEAIKIVGLGDVEALAHELGILALDDARRVELGKLGSQIVKERFDASSNMATAVQYLSQLVEMRKGATPVPIHCVNCDPKLFLSRQMRATRATLNRED
jgi:teichuronic acid biosynthesis glycosyltransferase TuaC